MAVAFLLTAARAASADQIVTTSGKGIVGGALLGAETVVLAESLIGIRSPWAHAAGAVAGAIGGGVGGYYIETSSSDGRIPLSLLAGGLVLAIPTIVVSLNATSYSASDAPAESPPPAPAVIGLRGGHWSPGVPVPEISNVFAPSELKQFGMQQRTQVQLPLLHVRF